MFFSVQYFERWLIPSSSRLLLVLSSTNTVEIWKVMFCRVLANRTRGIQPRYCRPSSVRHSYPYQKIMEVWYPSSKNYPGCGCITYVTCVGSQRPCHKTRTTANSVTFPYSTRNCCNLCKIPIPLRVTSLTCVRLWHNTRGTSIPLIQNPGSPQECILVEPQRVYHALNYDAISCQ